MHPGPGGERGGIQEEQLQPRQRDMEVCSHFAHISLLTIFKMIQGEAMFFYRPETKFQKAIYQLTKSHKVERVQYPPNPLDINLADSPSSSEDKIEEIR